jgi:hypothetical protein
MKKKNATNDDQDHNPFHGRISLPCDVVKREVRFQ